MRTLKSREGYLLIDHQASPGVPDAMTRGTALAGAPIGEGKVLEISTLTCGHCKTVSIKNPLRTRERGHCFKCHHYVCDGCAVALKETGVCRPWTQVVDDVVDGKTTVPILARNLRKDSLHG